MPIQVSRRAWLALFSLALAVYAAIALMPLLINIALLLFLTALLALLIYPLATRLEQRGIRRSWTVAGVLLLILALFSGLVFQLVPLLVNSLDALASLLETQAPRLREVLPGLTETASSDEGGRSVINMLTNVMLQAAGTIGNLAGRLGAGFFMLFVILVLVFTLVSNPEASRNLLRFFVPVRYHERVTSLTYSISEGLARWFFAQLSISGYYILAYGIVNTVLGVPFGIPIAIIAGLLEFIPYLGGIVGLILSALAAATLGTEAVIWILITNTIIGSVCVYFVSPYFFARAINVPVAGILLGLFIGGQVGGFFAALLTIPVVTIVVILLRELRPQRVPVSNTTTPASVPPPEGMAAEEG